MQLFIVMYSECAYEPETIVKVFDSKIRAENYIASMHDMPQLDNEGYTNNDYYDPDNLYIDDTQTLG